MRITTLQFSKPDGVWLTFNLSSAMMMAKRGNYVIAFIMLCNEASLFTHLSLSLPPIRSDPIHKPPFRRLTIQNV